jgi:hypothetical protein
MTEPLTTGPLTTGPLPLTAGRRVALALGTPVALLVIGWTALTAVAWAGQGSYRVNLAIPARGHSVVVEVAAGQVTVGPAPGARIRVRGTARYALARSTVRWQATAAEVAVHGQCRQPTGPCSFNFAVGLPARVHSTISVGSGDLTARGLAGPVTLVADSGAVHASALSGHAEITDRSGTITGSALSGASVLVQDSSGDISLNALRGRDLTVEDKSGDITLTFARVPGRVQVSDLSGNVRLVLPAGQTAYRVTASSAAGVTRVGVPTNPSSAHVITVTDQSGNVVVTRGHV